MRGKLLLLHQQRLVQLTLVLLDLLLHVGDCTCNLGRAEEQKKTETVKYSEKQTSLRSHRLLRLECITKV